MRVTRDVHDSSEGNMSCRQEGPGWKLRAAEGNRPEHPKAEEKNQCTAHRMAFSGISASWMATGEPWSKTPCNRKQPPGMPAVSAKAAKTQPARCAPQIESPAPEVEFDDFAAEFAATEPAMWNGPCTAIGHGFFTCTMCKHKI
ncbi:unnamed protein product [Durusdinium trenchii]|uniref:Uncharacterized protein n=1 Tax=Durusdinium trenchii TaxID=1381693 RepID=A0ABP0KSY4_9DINO